MSYILVIILSISVILLYKKNGTKTKCDNCNACKNCEVKK